MKTDISEEQIEQCREIFNLYDKDGDGTIDSRELGDIMRSLGIYPSNEERFVAVCFYKDKFSSCILYTQHRNGNP